MDTDIGTDVDDLLALAVALGSPELDLEAVTTVYGDTLLRARMVHRAYALAGRPVPPVAAGSRETRSGKAVWWAGHEGVLMADLDREPFDEALDAGGLLRASKVIAAIGPLSNVADALEGPHQIEQLVIMGGDFRSVTPEHNLACDTTAAQVVFSSGTPALIVGIDQTERVVLDADQVAAIGGCGALGTHLVAEITQFRQWLGRPDSPHDAVALLALVRPDLFTFATGEVAVGDSGNTTLRRHADGPHRVVTDLDAEAVARDLVSRIKQAQW